MERFGIIVGDSMLYASLQQMVNFLDDYVDVAGLWKLLFKRHVVQEITANEFVKIVAWLDPLIHVFSNF